MYLGRSPEVLCGCIFYLEESFVGTCSLLGAAGDGSCLGLRRRGLWPGHSVACCGRHFEVVGLLWLVRGQ